MPNFSVTIETISITNSSITLDVKTSGIDDSITMYTIQYENGSLSQKSSSTFVINDLDSGENYNFMAIVYTKNHNHYYSNSYELITI